MDEERRRTIEQLPTLLERAEVECLVFPDAATAAHLAGRRLDPEVKALSAAVEAAVRSNEALSEPLDRLLVEAVFQAAVRGGPEVEAEIMRVSEFDEKPLDPAEAEAAARRGLEVGLETTKRHGDRLPRLRSPIEG